MASSGEKPRPIASTTCETSQTLSACPLILTVPSEEILKLTFPILAILLRSDPPLPIRAATLTFGITTSPFTLEGTVRTPPSPKDL